MKKMIITVIAGKSEMRDIEVDVEMRIADLLNGLFPGVPQIGVYNASGGLLDPNNTFGAYSIMNGDVLLVRAS